MKWRRIQPGKARFLLGASALVFISTASGFAQEARAQGQAKTEEVVVTGTRIVSSINAEAPTPVTVVSAEQLLETSPRDLPDGLNKLPIFQGSTFPQRPGGGGGGNISQNVLALRNFGAQRTLVLLDGHRLTPSNPDGTVDIDTIPQALITRVDVTTGGASAVYGSDAVTGVVNFILDKNFTGIKVNAHAGISTYGDGDNQKINVVYGTPLLGGKGHFLGSLGFRQTGIVDVLNRPGGPDVIFRTGAGTAASPFVLTQNTRRTDSSYGGRVYTCTGAAAACPGNGRSFAQDGILSPFDAGTATGTSGIASGGDGAFVNGRTSAFVKGRYEEAFARFSYDFDNGVNFYLQGSSAEAYTFGRHFVDKITPSTAQPSIFFKNNPFLPAAARALLGDNGQTNATNTFGIGSYIVNQGTEGLVGTRNVNQYNQIQTGLNGTLYNYRWDLFFTHGWNRQKTVTLNNQNNQKLYAAEDAVVGANGTIQCYAATQAATASRYSDCVPINAFGPTAITAAAYDYFNDDTFQQYNTGMDNVGGSITGSLFDLWAGPVDFALSGESRWTSYNVKSSTDPGAFVDCTGLRLCAPAASPLLIYGQAVVGAVDKSNSVWEFAGELAIPLLKDVRLADSLNLTLAGRYTDYSTSGPVQTWKMGADWAVNSVLRFRSTLSYDIRAPTLNDLYKPQSATNGLFNDLHTAKNQTAYTFSQGNPALVPETARTFTVGAVLTPHGSWLEGLTASADYYRIKLGNAIGAITASNTTIQQLCEDSNGTSVYCSLYQRPLPFADRSAANFPTAVYNLNLNTTVTQIEGFDFELNYHMEVLGGDLSLRGLANYQPVELAQAFIGAQVSRTAGPKGRVTSTLRYNIDDWDFSIQDRWLSSWDQRTTFTQFYVNPYLDDYHSVDVSIAWNTQIAGADSKLYFTMENAFNEFPPIVGFGSVGGGLPYPGTDYNPMGRYFTIGISAKM